MSANIPSQSSVNLTPQQQERVGEQLKAMGVNIDPKELKNMTMDQLQKKLAQMGKPDAFEKIKSVMKSFSADGQKQSIPGSNLKLPSGMAERLKALFIKKFGKEEGMVKFQQFVQQLQNAYPDGNIPTDPKILKKEVIQALEKMHVPQGEAKTLADHAIQGASEGGLGTISSGGAETE